MITYLIARGATTPAVSSPLADQRDRGAGRRKTNHFHEPSMLSSQWSRQTLLLSSYPSRSSRHTVHSTCLHLLSSPLLTPLSPALPCCPRTPLAFIAMSALFLCLLPLPQSGAPTHGAPDPCNHASNHHPFGYPAHASNKAASHTGPITHPSLLATRLSLGGAEPATPFRVWACVRSYLYKHTSLNA
ncbi:hypothetical protein BKA80DRAFT_275772 [Phyllosticta citrichinensis]